MTRPTAPTTPTMSTPPPGTPPVLWKVYLAFLVPMIFSNILQALSGTVNNIYLGQMLGVGAMASVVTVKKSHPLCPCNARISMGRCSKFVARARRGLV